MEVQCRLTLDRVKERQAGKRMGVSVGTPWIGVSSLFAEKWVRELGRGFSSTQEVRPSTINSGNPGQEFSFLPK